MDKINEWMPWLVRCKHPANRANFWIAFNAVWPDGSPEDIFAVGIARKNVLEISKYISTIINKLNPKEAELFWASVYATRLTQS